VEPVTFKGYSQVIPQLPWGWNASICRLFARKLMPSDFDRQRYFRMENGDTWYKNLSHFAHWHSLVESHFDTAQFVGDKVPRAYEFFDHLISHFPDVRFLCLVRNVFDVAASYEARRRAMNNWNPDWGARKAVEHWNASLRAVLTYASVAPILPIIYEDLIATETTLDPVAEFLNIDPKPLRESWEKNRRPEARPQPGAGAARLAAEDVAYITANADQDALARVTRLARKPVAYRGAWQTLGPPPPDRLEVFRGRLASLHL
jgi:hypothetical protein